MAWTKAVSLSLSVFLSMYQFVTSCQLAVILEFLVVKDGDLARSLTPCMFNALKMTNYIRNISIEFFYDFLYFLYVFFLSSSIFFSSILFGQRPLRGRWPMNSHTREIFPSPPPSTPFKAHILALRLISQPWGLNPSVEAQILTSRPKSYPRGSNPDRKAKIPASKLKSQPWGPNSSLRAQIPA